MIKVAVVGLGKMGLSHHAMINVHPDVTVVGVCDSSSLILRMLKKYTGIPTFSNYEVMLREARPDAVIIATPSAAHASMVKQALDRDVHVFCEKPFTLDSADSFALADQAAARQLVTQVGYHNRFVGTFAEVKRLLDMDAIGVVTHALGEAYGPVVLKSKGSTWRSQRSQGGGCLHDYAAHVIDLLTWYLGEPSGVGGTSLNAIFSRDTHDAVYGTLYFEGGRTAQLSANWSDESQRKMTTKVTLWGTHGWIYVDRQELQLYLRDTAQPPMSYRHGWNVRYTTDLTVPVWFYLRGEEYSAQLDTFVRRVHEREQDGVSTFVTAAMTDRVIDKLQDDAMRPQSRPDTGRGFDVPSRAASVRTTLADRGLARVSTLMRAVSSALRNR